MSTFSRLGKLLLPEFYLEKNREQAKLSKPAESLPKQAKLSKPAEDLSTANIKIAQEIMGSENFLGPKEVFNTFGVKLKKSEIPPIPFSKEELKTAARLNQKLILRISTAKDGSPLTMQKMNEELEEKFETVDKGAILYDNERKDEEFFTTETPTKSKAQWALVSTKIIPNSFRENYLEQTEILVDYLKTGIMPTLSKTKQAQYEEAIAEFETQKETIQELMDEDDCIEASEQLAELQINQMTRQSPSQVLYDLLLTFDNKGERLLKEMNTWTKALDSSGSLVYVGHFDACGADVSAYDALDRGEYRLGVAFSRTL